MNRMSIVLNISTLDDLAEAGLIIARGQYAGCGLYAHLHLRLCADIDATATAGWYSGRGFMPLGWYDEGSTSRSGAFRGSFDGRGHTISNLTINRPTYYYQGLFSHLVSANIRNLNLVNCSISGYNYTGSLAGHSSHSHVECVHIDGGSVTGRLYAGGAIGYCTASDVDDPAPTYDHPLRDRHLPILTGVSVLGTGITSSHSYVGGLVGFSQHYAIHESSAKNVAVLGSSYVGGLVGRGGTSANTGRLRNVCATGSVEGVNYIGGLIGQHRGSLSKSFAACSVVGGVGQADVGGLIGDNQGTISQSYWDTQVSGKATSDGGEGKTTAEMKDIATYSGWSIGAVADGNKDTSYIWNIVDGQAYPFLHREHSTYPDPEEAGGTVWLEAQAGDVAKLAFVGEDGVKRTIEGVLPPP